MSSRRTQQDVGDINEQIRQQHEQLRDLAHSISQALGVRQLPPDEIVRQLSVLRDGLESHFRNEETAGFLEQIAEHAPRLAGRTARLCAEHLEILSETNNLLEQVMQGDGSEGWWCFIEAAFHDFRKRLMEHEREENELLQRAYSDDIGSKD